MSDFSWKIWLTKWGKGLGLTLAATACVYTAEYMNVTTFPTEYAFWGAMLAVTLSQIGNFITHTVLAKPSE